MNKPVRTTSGGCGCGDQFGSVTLQPPGGSGGDSNIIVRSKPGISIGNIINKFQETGKTIYELDDQILVIPGVAFSNNSPAISEIGETIALVTFTGTITQGSNPLASRVISPDPGGLNLAAPFNFNKANVKRTTPGVAELHTVTATDTLGNAKAVQSGVQFKYAFYQGFNTLGTLNQAQIKALANRSLNDNLLQQYGGTKNYTVPSSPSTPKYIYWCGPVGTPTIAAASLSGLALPLVDHAQVEITNPFDGAITTTYWVKRTANMIDPGTYAITIS